jgi:DNA-binding transcriptional LysR family regulator
MDLNLLVAFEALYRERSVTRAGRRLGLSQPATSAALGKLRAAFDDPLFVKTPRGLEPTERCETLAKPIARALAELRDAVGEEEFDPKTSDRIFRIGAVDPVLAVIAPRLVANVLAEAPNARLDFRVIGPNGAVASIDAREIELAIAPVPNVPAHCSSIDLFPITLVVAVRPNHPLSAAPSVEELTRYPHAVVVLEGPTRTVVDDALAIAGIQRRIGVVSGSFLAVPEVLAASDAVALLPAPFARKLEREGRLRCAKLPKEISAQPRMMKMVWPSRIDGSKAWRWLRDHVERSRP